MKRFVVAVVTAMTEFRRLGALFILLGNGDLIRSLPRHGWIVLITGLIVALIGLAIAVLGAWLLYLGGSTYYLIAGVLLLLSGILIAAGRPSGVWIYALVLIGTVAWAIQESGLDGWALIPRLIAPLVLGLWLFSPLVAGRLHRAGGFGDSVHSARLR